MQIRSQDIAVGDLTAEVAALVHGALESRDVPTVDEIAMEAVASSVSVCKDKGLLGAHITLPEFELVGLEDDFVEDGDKLDWVGGRARTVIVSARSRV